MRSTLSYPADPSTQPKCEGRRQIGVPRILRSLLLYLLAAVCTLPLTGQEPPTLELRKKKEVKVQGESAAGLLLMLPIRCDADGNVYLRTYHAQAPGRAPLVRISTEGEKSFFTVASAPGSEKSDAEDFAVRLRGEVYLPAAKKGSLANVLIFDKDGRYKSAVKLEGSFLPEQLAVFVSGDFLVSGNRLDTETNRPTYEPFTGIFDPAGRLVKEISLPGDVEPEEVKLSDDEASPTRLQNPGLELGIAEPAEDGNFYLMRSVADPLFYVISPAGELLRRIVVSSPGPEYRPIAMKPAAGRLLVKFERPARDPSRGGEQIYSTADIETGERLIDYTISHEEGGIFACYSAKGFTFLATTDKFEMVLRHAAP